MGRRQVRSGPGLPSVSVVIAAYDAGRFVDETLASLAAQVLLPERVIVVDDASRDDTEARVRRWDDRLPLVVMTAERNAGAGAARALAMQQVTTELACFLDADDVVRPDHLDHLVRLWCRRGGVISPRVVIWNGESAMADYHRSLGLSVPRRRQLARLLAVNYVAYGALFDKDTYDRAGGLRPLRLAEDWDLWARMAASGARFSLATRPTLLYRRHEHNVTTTETAVEAERARLNERFFREHPEWLSSREWEGALRYGAELTAGRKGLTMLRSGDVRGLRLLTALRGPSAVQVMKQSAYFAVCKARGRSSPRL